MPPIITRGRALVATIQRLQAIPDRTDAEQAELEAAQGELRALVVRVDPVTAAQVFAVLDPGATIPIIGHSLN